MNYTTNSVLKCLVLAAEDYDMATITGVKADLGKLPGNYATNSWAYNWAISANYASAYGCFTTDASGIVVQNTFKIYNTDTSLRNANNGDLSVTTSATSTDANRVAPLGSYTDVKINGTGLSASKLYEQVNAGTNAEIKGLLGVYSVPQACYTTSASASYAGTTALIVDPEIYLLLPEGISYDDTGLSFELYSYNANNTKTGVESDLSYQVDNVSYLNTTGDGVSIYRISFDKGTYIGLYDSDGLQYKIGYTITLTTSRSLESKPYYLNDLIQVSSANNFTAAYYSSSLVNTSTVNTVKEDTYGINGGNKLAGISVGTDSAQLYFSLQQQEELGVYNAVSVTKIDGQDVTEAWYSYDASNPNSIAMLGANSEGRMRVTFNNTANFAATDVVAVVPIPKAGSDLGSALMDSTPEFSMSMSFDALPSGFTATYIKLSDTSSSSVRDWAYETVSTDEANAILIKADSIANKTSPIVYLDFKVTDGTASAQNIWRNAFAYDMNSANNITGNGNLVASEVAKGIISGTVYFDSNADGIMDSGEAGVAGVTVTVTDA